MMTYVFTVRLRPGEDEEIEEVSAPGLFTAVEMLATVYPGLHLIKFEGICREPAQA